MSCCDEPASVQGCNRPQHATPTRWPACITLHIAISQSGHGESWWPALLFGDSHSASPRSSGQRGGRGTPVAACAGCSGQVVHAFGEAQGQAQGPSLLRPSRLPLLRGSDSYPSVRGCYSCTDGGTRETRLLQGLTETVACLLDPTCVPGRQQAHAKLKRHIATSVVVAEYKHVDRRCFEVCLGNFMCAELWEGRRRPTTF
jgi:hypothetical protein